MIKEIKRGQTTSESQQWVHLTLEYAGETYLFNHVAPLNLDDKQLQGFVGQRERRYLADIYKDMYPGADYHSFDGNDELAQIEAWIEAGCANEVKIGEDEKDEFVYRTETIEKVPFQGTHPREERVIDGKRLSEATKVQMEKASTVKELRQVLRDILLGREE